MESIKVTTENLVSKANEVDGKADEYCTNYSQLLNDVATLTSTDWKGADADAFLQQIEGFREDFVKMKDLMNEYANFMRTASKSYDNTQENVISQIKSLQN